MEKVKSWKIAIPDETTGGFTNFCNMYLVRNIKQLQYVLHKNVPGTHIRYPRFSNYFNGLPKNTLTPIPTLSYAGFIPNREKSLSGKFFEKQYLQIPIPGDGLKHHNGLSSQQ